MGIAVAWFYLYLQKVRRTDQLEKQWRTHSQRATTHFIFFIMNIENLNKHPQLISTVVTWWFNEWSHLNPDPTNTLEKAISSLRAKLSNNEFLPHVLVAFDDKQVVGVASLKLHELYEHFPKTPYWLGSVYVDEPARGAGVASTLVREIEQAAIDRNISTLHLTTEQLDGGLYKRLGWKPVTTLIDRGDEVLVMNKHLV